MNAVPIFPESRNPVPAAVALLLAMVAVVLAAGCAGDCPGVLHTATITKLDGNGTVSWTKVLDSGLSNTIADAIPTSDGGFVTAGSIVTTHSYCTLNSQARIIRFTGTGDILWDRSISDLGGASEIIQMHDGGFAALVSGNNIYRLDPEGKMLWNNSAISSSLYQRSMINSKDGSLYIVGPEFIKLDSNGIILWQRSIVNGLHKWFFSVAEVGKGQGFYIFSAVNRSDIQKDFFNNDGAFLNSTNIVTGRNLTGYHLFNNPNGFKLLYSENSVNVTIIEFDINGSVIDIKRITGSNDITLTEDMGYFFVANTGNQIKAVKLNPDETTSWNTTIPINLRNLNIINIIQTTDGGFVIISDNGVQKDISTLQ